MWIHALQSFSEELARDTYNNALLEILPFAIVGAIIGGLCWYAIIRYIRRK